MSEPLLLLFIGISHLAPTLLVAADWPATVSAVDEEDISCPPSDAATGGRAPSTATLLAAALCLLPALLRLSTGTILRVAGEHLQPVLALAGSLLLSSLDSKQKATLPCSFLLSQVVGPKQTIKRPTNGAHNKLQYRSAGRVLYPQPYGSIWMLSHRVEKQFVYR